MFAIILATLATQIVIERITILTARRPAAVIPSSRSAVRSSSATIAISYQLFWILGCGA